MQMRTYWSKLRLILYVLIVQLLDLRYTSVVVIISEKNEYKGDVHEKIILAPYFFSCILHESTR